MIRLHYQNLLGTIEVTFQKYYRLPFARFIESQLAFIGRFVFHFNRLQSKTLYDHLGDSKLLMNHQNLHRSIRHLNLSSFQWGCCSAFHGFIKAFSGRKIRGSFCSGDGSCLMGTFSLCRVRIFLWLEAICGMCLWRSLSPSLIFWLLQFHLKWFKRQ